MNEQAITVTSPLLPDLGDFHALLEEIWSSKWITNNGSFHQRLEKELADYLGVPFLSLFTNGTLPLITALQALGIHDGEVITTPYSFVATTHALWWNGITPVFVDVDPATGNIDPERVEEAITPRTRAIMPVHVYGQPCDTARLGAIARAHGLRLIYDGAHAFGVQVGGKSVLAEGDMATLSFHATKVYNTIEGGALVTQDAATKQRIDQLKNFGFTGETTVVAPGINSKMDEMRAAYGLLTLRMVDGAIDARQRAAARYRDALRGTAGLRFLEDAPGVRGNASYFPLFIDAAAYGCTRDELYARMKERNILGRRYFYPLISSFEPYHELPSANPASLPNAQRLADSVLCLPMHHALSDSDIDRVLDAILT